MRSYLLGLASRVKYRLANTLEKKQEVCAFAISVTEKSFPQGNPVMYLATEVLDVKNDGKAPDRVFSEILCREIKDAGFEENGDYLAIVKLLEAVKPE